MEVEGLEWGWRGRDGAGGSGWSWRVRDEDGGARMELEGLGWSWWGRDRAGGSGWSCTLPPFSHKLPRGSQTPPAPRPSPVPGQEGSRAAGSPGQDQGREQLPASQPWVFLSLFPTLPLSQLFPLRATSSSGEVRGQQLPAPHHKPPSIPEQRAQGSQHSPGNHLSTHLGS